MNATAMYGTTNSKDRAQILTLIHSRLSGTRGAMEVESRDLTIRLGDDVAFSDGLVRMTGSKESEEPEQFWMREMMCFERDGEGWRIVHEHISEPRRVDGGADGELRVNSKLRVGWAHGEPELQPCREPSFV